MARVLTIALLLVVPLVIASNKFGVGLVTEGTSDQINLVKALAGDRGWVKKIGKLKSRILFKFMADPASLCWSRQQYIRRTPELERFRSRSLHNFIQNTE